MLKTNILRTMCFLCFVFATGVTHQESNAMRETSFGGSPTVIQVPGDVGDLQSAINQIPDGGIIELAAGIYASPVGGWSISNLGKGFTIQAASAGTVALDGGGTRDLIRLMNSSPAQGGPVVFKDIKFQNGFSSTEGVAGGITVYRGEVSFVNCSFENNTGNQPSTGGGGIVVAINSIAFFFDTTWIGNHAKNFGGGLALETSSTAYIYNSHFINNRVNLPGHLTVSAGGGIHVGDSTLRVSNTRFEGNQAGYAGGALYGVGTWAAPFTTPQTSIVVSNSTFINNQAVRDPSVIFANPTEAGAVHFEDQTVGKIYNSRFFTNSAMTGGGVNLYRANVEIHDSVFRGNYTTSTNPAEGFGSAISAISNDTTIDGGTNYPSANLLVRNSFIQGRYGSVDTVGMIGGGISVIGDTNRMYGLNGIVQMGTVADNRAVAVIENIVIVDTDVTIVSGVAGSGVGAGLFSDLGNVTITDSLIAGADTVGIGDGSGGGMAIINQSLLNADGLTLIKNSASRWGGAVFGQGSTLNLNNCIIAENAISVVGNQSLGGAAIYTAPDFGRGVKADGALSNCTVSNNTGIPIFDGDANSASTYNDMRYNSNVIHTTYQTDKVYSASLTGYFNKTVADLNALTIIRSNGPDTPKSQVDNTALGVPAKVGAILAVPPQVLPTHAYGDPVGNVPTFIGYAWSGGSATLNGGTVAGNLGFSTTTNPGNFTLVVGGTTIGTVAASLGPAPAATFNNSGNSPISLSWSVTVGTFLEAGIDQEGGTKLGAAAGSVNVSPSVDTTYHFYAITEEGGIMLSTTTGVPTLSAPSSTSALAGQNLAVNKGAFAIQNIGGGTLNWTAVSNTPDLLTIDTPSGQASGGESDTVTFTIDIGSLTPGTYPGEIFVNGGSAGSQTVNVTVELVDILLQTYLPIVIR